MTRQEVDKLTGILCDTAAWFFHNKIELGELISTRSPEDIQKFVRNHLKTLRSINEKIAFLTLFSFGKVVFRDKEKYIEFIVPDYETAWKNFAHIKKSYNKHRPIKIRVTFPTDNMNIPDIYYRIL